MTVTYEVSGDVATIRLARPEARNALDNATKSALRDAVQRAASDDAARAVLLTGDGTTFCAGQDLREHAALLEQVRPRPGQADPEQTGEHHDRNDHDDLAGPDDPDGSDGSDDQGALDALWRSVPDHYIPISHGLMTMPKPVIAAVNGVAAGAGASIAFACDFRVLAADGGFVTAFASIGLPCDTGMSWTLPRLVGAGRATDLLMRPRTVRADEALQLGLATSVVPSESLLSSARELAGQLAAGPTTAYAGIKAALAHSADNGLEESLRFEGEMMREAGQTADHRNAVESFLSKQRPTFTGR